MNYQIIQACRERTLIIPITEKFLKVLNIFIKGIVFILKKMNKDKEYRLLTYLS